MGSVTSHHHIGFPEVLIFLSGFIGLCLMIYYYGRGSPQTCRCGCRFYGFPKYCPKCGHDVGL